MWLAFYNKEHVGDVLLLTRGQSDRAHLETKSNKKVTAVKDTQANEIKSYNIFDVSEIIEIEGKGSIQLNESNVEKINQIISEAGFETPIQVDNSPKFVVGHVESNEPHEDSDHLSVTQTNVGDQTVQIVCGADNIDEGLDVLVALPGAVMPSGTIIWPGELRGVTSNGMICSTRELGLTNIEDLPGIWELSESFKPGTTLEEVVAAYK